MDLTARSIAALPRPERGNRLYFDDSVRGLAVRVTAGGSRAFVLNYRFERRERRLTIGDVGAWSLAAARQQANKLKREIDLGNDPLAVRQRPDDRFVDRAKEFIAHGRKRRGEELRPSTLAQYKRALLDHAEVLHDRQLDEVRRRDVATLIRKLAVERGEVAAARSRGALARFYSWCIASDYCAVNPVVGTEGYPATKGRRVLSDAELRALWLVTEDPSDFHTIVRLLLLTGARRSEIGSMSWAEIDGRTWTLPSARSKSGRPLVLPLPRQVMAALAALEGPREGFLFGSAGFVSWSKAKRKLDAALRFNEPWTIHDIRRTTQTKLAEIGVGRDVVNKILNHGMGPIDETYDLHSYLPEKAAALQRLADRIGRIVLGEADNTASSEADHTASSEADDIASSEVEPNVVPLGITNVVPLRQKSS